MSKQRKAFLTIVTLIIATTAGQIISNDVFYLVIGSVWAICARLIWNEEIGKFIER